jgi:CubicO group peptidase (beta-lactamase class C family)
VTPTQHLPQINVQHWQARLDELARTYDVPGATLGILRVRPGQEDELVEAASGVLNLNTGVETTTDSLFQIGSITKVWTATVIMQLVDEGLLDLDAPIIEVLPELRLADAEVAKHVTMRHLLTHTNGIDGDIFTDTGRGDDALEKYVASLSDAAQTHPLGATWSYSNSGLSLAGRVIEKLLGGTWDKAMQERLFAPLGLSHTVTLAEEAILFRAAAGHLNDDQNRPAVAPVWAIPRSSGPAGSIISSVADVLAFARMHLTGGTSADGTRVLSESMVTLMAEKHADLPDKHLLGDSWGLGWERMGWDDNRLIGHDGNTFGQAAFLRMLPSQGLAVTLLTNGGNGAKLYEDLFREIFSELAGVAVPYPLGPPAEPVTVDASPYLGTYQRSSVKLEVIDGENGLVMRVSISGPLAEMINDTAMEFPMVAVDDALFVCQDPDSGNWIPATFYGLPTGERYVHFGARATPKTA